MKKINLGLMALLVLLMGCEKIDSLTKFNIEYDETVVFSSSTGLNLPFNLITPDMETNSESTFASNDTRKELIEEIILTKLDLTLTSPTNGDLGFLKSIEIYITADGLSDVKVAWKDNIPSNIDKFLELDTSNADIQEFIKKDEFSLKVSSVTDEVLASDHHIDIHSEFFVDAKILGQ